MNKFKRTFGFITSHPLSKAHPVKAMWRLLLWQLQSKISPDKFWVKPFIGTVNFYARKGLTGITGNIYTGLHEFNEMGFLLHFLMPADTFYDIGANVGSYTLLAAGISNAKCVTLEPVKATFEILTDNVSLNNLQHKVLLVNSAAGDKPGKVNFSVGMDTENHALAEDEYDKTGSVETTVVTVDSLLSNGQPGLIKIDVEGYETQVLKGMDETLELDGLKAIIIELNGSGTRYGFDEKKIHDLLLSKKFRPHTYNPFTKSLTPIDSFGTHNTIYCRDLDFINSRLKQAKPVKVMGELF